MSEKLENTIRLIRIIERTRLHDNEAAKFIAQYVLAYMEDSLDALPDIDFHPWAGSINHAFAWDKTPQGWGYWNDLNKKVGIV